MTKQTANVQQSGLSIETLCILTAQGAAKLIELKLKVIWSEIKYDCLDPCTDESATSQSWGLEKSNKLCLDPKISISFLNLKL